MHECEKGEGVGAVMYGGIRIKQGKREKKRRKRKKEEAGLGRTQCEACLMS